MNADVLKLERSEQEIWSALWRRVDSEPRKQLGMEIRQVADADCLIMEKIPNWFFNRVIGLGVSQPLLPSIVDELITMYHSRNLPIGISLCPHTVTREISDWLRQRGFEVANQWVKMIRDNSIPKSVDCDLRIELAAEDESEQVAEVIVRGFELHEALEPVFTALTCNENNRVYIAWDDQIPAAVGVLSVYQNTGHLNTAATLPEYRGRGAQGAIMAKRIEAGIKLGCTNFVTETWQPEQDVNHSYNNMLKQGFALAYMRPNWVLAAPES